MFKTVSALEEILGELPSPCYVVDKSLLEKNAQKLAECSAQSGAKILLALKGFSMWSTFPILSKYLDGVAASSPWEARLGRQEFGKEVHGYAPAYKESELEEMDRLCDHLVFNSLSQAEALSRHCSSSTRLGIRVNPEHSEVATALYDPCAPGSRLGVTIGAFKERLPEGISGIHMHTLCELGADALERTVLALREKANPLLEQSSWINLGGGHHITRDDYDVAKLASVVGRLKDDFGLEVILEPGEAIALNTGWLVSEIVDITNNNGPIAILDTSATAHMPDVLEMPYRPQIWNAGAAGEKKHTYVLGGMTCLAGDVIGEYSFDEALKVGDRLIFGDMAHYSMVKNTTFNGVQLPAIVEFSPISPSFEVIRRFHYDDFRNRLS